MAYVVWVWLVSAWAWFTPDRVIAVSTAAYGLVTIVIALLILSQTKAAHRQAEIAEKTAQAAADSAEALANAERAWVIVRRVEAKPGISFKGRFKPNFPQDAPNGPIIMIPDPDPPPMEVWCYLDNVGRTPALILNARVKFHLVGGFDSLPEHPCYDPVGTSRELPQYGRLLAQRDSFHVSGKFETKGTFEPGFLTADEMSDVRASRLLLCAYGLVIYRDIGNFWRHTKFCFTYHVPSEGDPAPEGFRMEGPPEYNKCD